MTGVGVEVGSPRRPGPGGPSPSRPVPRRGSELRGGCRRGDPGCVPVLSGCCRDRRERPGGRRGRGRRRADPGADRARGEGAGMGSGRGARAGRDRVSGGPSGRRLDPCTAAAPHAVAGGSSRPAGSRRRRSRPGAVRQPARATRGSGAGPASHRGTAPGLRGDHPRPLGVVRLGLRLGQRQGTRPPSTFLVDIRDLAEIDEWFVPADDAANPRLRITREAMWPVDPLGDRRPDLEAGAALVQAAMRRGPPAPGIGARSAAVLPGLLADRQDRAAGWRRDVDLLLAEHAAVSAPTASRSPSGPAIRVAARRPPPRPGRVGPAAAAPIAGQAGPARPSRHAPSTPGSSAGGRRRRCSTSTSCPAQQTRAPTTPTSRRCGAPSRPVRGPLGRPYEVEVPFDMTVGPAWCAGGWTRCSRDADGGLDRRRLEDRQPGRPAPTRRGGGAARRLSAGLGRLQGLGDARVGEVRAAFHYVRTGETLAPADLLDADGDAGVDQRRGRRRICAPTACSAGVPACSAVTTPSASRS